MLVRFFLIASGVFVSWLILNFIGGHLASLNYVLFSLGKGTDSHGVTIANLLLIAMGIFIVRACWKIK